MNKNLMTKYLNCETEEKSKYVAWTSTHHLYFQVIYCSNVIDLFHIYLYNQE